MAEVDLYVAIGAGMRRLRTAAGWTQQETAARLQSNGLPWSRTNLADGEAGRRRFGVADLIVVCQTFGCAPADLVRGDTPIRVTRQATYGAALVRRRLGRTDEDDLEATLDTPGVRDLGNRMRLLDDARDRLRPLLPPRALKREFDSLLLEADADCRDEAVRRAAARAGVDPLQFAAAARLRYGVGFVEQRNLLAEERWPEPRRKGRPRDPVAVARSRQGARSQAARMLTDEIADYIAHRLRATEGSQ